MGEDSQVHRRTQAEAHDQEASRGDCEWNPRNVPQLAQEDITMADGISVTVEGLVQLQTKLDALTTKQADRCIRTALKAGGVIEQAAIAERAPVKDGAGGML